jgi:hypothetical protein
LKNTVKKAFLFLVLALLVAGGAFAQRVGDTVKVGGNDYRLEEVRGDGRLVFQPVPTLDGVWESSQGAVLTINGSTAVRTQFSSNNNDALTQDAINKGFMKIGDQTYRNLRKTGDLTWTGQIMGLDFKTNALMLL